MRLSGRNATRAAVLLALGCAARSQLDTPLVVVAARATMDPEPALSPEPEPLRALLLQVAAVRGLEPGRTPALLALPARQLARRAQQQFVRDVPEAVRRAQAELLWRLELVPRGFDLSAALANAFVGRLQAFYVGTPPTVFVDSALAGAARQRALAHELVHALQDARHALTRRLEYEPDGWDRQSALHALAEADALAVVERWGGSDAGDSAALEGAPPTAVPGVIACSLAAPYRDGRARVSEVLARGGFGALDALLRDPPQGTHQLLHPGELVVARSSEPPFRAPGSDWRAVYSDVLGEQSLRCVLEQWAPESVAAELAGGWAADRVTSFARGADAALIWDLTFDRAARAVQVASLLRSKGWMTRGRASAAGSAWTCQAHSDAGVVGVLRQGCRLLFASLVGVPVSDGCVSLEGWLRQ